MLQKNKIILVIFLIVIGIKIYAQNASDFTFTFTDDFEGVVITGYIGTAASVTIPATIESFPVREIGREAFNEKRITSIIIPNGVKYIGNGAFRKCSQLTSVTIPGSVIKIGSSAFDSCTSLRSVVLHNNIEHIENYAFTKSGLITIELPAKLTEVKDGVFSECVSLTSVIIPEGVTSIGFLAFNKCTSLSSITLPSTIKTIGTLAFRDCSDLINVIIPDSVLSIEFSTFLNSFYNCSRLNLASQAALRRRGWDPNIGNY